MLVYETLDIVGNDEQFKQQQQNKKIGETKLSLDPQMITLL